MNVDETFRCKRCFVLAETNIDMAFQTSLLLFHLGPLNLNSVYIYSSVECMFSTSTEHLWECVVLLVS